jgi:hypothetical protein
MDFLARFQVNDAMMRMVVGNKIRPLIFCLMGSLTESGTRITCLFEVPSELEDRDIFVTTRVRQMERMELCVDS